MSVRGKWLLKFLNCEEKTAVKFLEELAKLVESSEEGWPTLSVSLLL